MFEYVEDKNVEVAGYSGRWDGNREKVIMVDMGEEIIHKHGLTELTLYGDRLHLYTQSSESYWLDWMKDRRLYVRRVHPQARTAGDELVQ